MSKHGWTYKKLGEVATFSRGLTYSKSDVVIESSNKVLRSNNIDLATHSLNFDDVVCLKEEFEIPFDKMLQPNDIFICMSNGSTQHLGKVAFIEKKIDYAFGGFMGAIHPNSDVIFPKFEFYYCLSSEYRRSLASVLNGININNIKWSDLSKFAIPVPPLAEQEWIVAELDLLQGIIEKKKEQLKAYDQLAQSIFYTMFGDPIDNPKGWETKQLGKVCKTTSGGTPSKNHTEYYDGGTIPWLRSGEVSQGFIYNTELFITEEGLKCSSAKMIPIDTVVIAMYGATVGQVGIIKSPMCTNQAICSILPNDIFIPIYLYYFLLSKKSDYLKVAVGGAQPNISQGIIKETVIGIPPLSLQQEFAEKVEAIERQKALVQQSIDETQTMFDYTMDKYFG